VHLVGFIIQIYHNAQPHEHQIYGLLFVTHFQEDLFSLYIMNMCSLSNGIFVYTLKLGHAVQEDPTN